MSGVALNAGGDGWVLSGVLDFSTVPEIWPALRALLERGEPISLSLAEVEHANSAGLAMLLEARDLAAQTGSDLRLRDLPADLLALAAMSDAGALLGND